MKPVKPKKMPKSLQAHLERIAKHASVGTMLPPRDVRSILAALEYERQRADKALDHIANHAEDFGGTPRGERFDAFLLENGRPRAALTFGERHSADLQREQTAAVVPPKRKMHCDCGHARGLHGLSGIGPCNFTRCRCKGFRRD